VKHGLYYVICSRLPSGVRCLAAVDARQPGDGLSRRELLLAGLVSRCFQSWRSTPSPFGARCSTTVCAAVHRLQHAYFRDTATIMVRGYDILGTFLSLDNYLDKRPIFIRSSFPGARP